MSAALLLARVALPRAVPALYDYLVPQELMAEARVGLPVLVPLKSQAVAGCLMELRQPERPVDPARYKEIKAFLSRQPLFGPSLARLILFAANYYHYPPGLCLAEALPAGLTPQTALRVRLTARGLAAPAFLKELASWPAPAGRKLAAAPEAGLTLSGRNSQPRLKALVRKALAAGYLEELPPEIKAGPGPKTEMRVRLKPGGLQGLARLGPREKSLLAELSEEYRPLDQLSPLGGSSLKAVLKRLAEKNLVEITVRTVDRDDDGRPLALNHENGAGLTLTSEQLEALRRIGAALKEGRQESFLLHGVTGSGKSEVYSRAARETLNLGRQVLWLVPEIALSAGAEGFLKSRFEPGLVAVLHSGLTKGQKYDQWLKIRQGRARIVLGARSAVFAPLDQLGLVVVDEEHDSAYKQGDGFRYQGRDLALWRAREAGGVALLGSATPSLESYQAALGGRLSLLRLKKRAGAAGFPKVTLLDNRNRPRSHSALNPELKRGLIENQARGRQGLVLINRRGLASLPLCLNCGQVLKCRHCSVNLTLHGPEDAPPDQSSTGFPQAHRLLCHHCGYTASPPEKCPHCQSPLVRYLGLGTEKIFKLIEKEFPGFRAARLDADSIRARGALNKILEAFGRRELDLLVGTQMAAKGHNFPQLTIVGVLEADLGLNLPDFRAAERTFQLLAQVAGRAGRASAPGLVYIQTLNPEHYTLKAAVNHDYEAFYRQEIILRSQLGYPPFSRLALARFSGPREDKAARAAEEAAAKAGKLQTNWAGELEILGPIPSPLARIKNNYRFQILIKSTKVAVRHAFLKAWLKELASGRPGGVRLTIDVDPYHLM